MGARDHAGLLVGVPTMMAALIALALSAAVPPTPPAEASVDAAVAVVRDYYAAIEARDYRAAYRLWHGRYSLAQVRAGYADNVHVRATPIPPFEADAGAGSVYCEVKVRVDAVLRSGRRQHFAGSFTLRRVNDVDGSTADQRRWHIIGAKLRPI
ncbi:hypothetical protein Q4F19_20875 [Sphingomonas sp. BIUV-7]|uniref:DUF4440 domain-containing protein n=1 Tax=Sphingomonas natans TaxID=3063330 RepID=A0ABT8YG80_9SPHN|nr:hypothetical protein [Sphingomonas sp. BIUV-7]MDO6416850.1 hypothetical protein [Sphingomonas sp. BIUV-7]